MKKGKWWLSSRLVINTDIMQMLYITYARNKFNVVVPITATVFSEGEEPTPAEDKVMKRINRDLEKGRLNPELEEDQIKMHALITAAEPEPYKATVWSEIGTARVLFEKYKNV